MEITEIDFLNIDEKKKVWSFLDQFDYIPFQQFPEYSTVEDLTARGWIAAMEGRTRGWVQAIEKKEIMVSLEFGPVSVDTETSTALLDHVLNYYKGRSFWLVRWIPYCYAKETFEGINSGVKKCFSMIRPEGETHWASKRIALHEPGENIVKKFSENHRRSIRKAATGGIRCKILDDAVLIKRFAEGYADMYRHRQLHVDAEITLQSFIRLYQYLLDAKKGFFLGAFNNRELLGGIIIIYQGKSAFYYKGYMDHEKRLLPVNHICFYEAILQAQGDDMKWFDFGGYALDTKDRQLANINKFKDGFKGELISFPPTRIIGLRNLSGLVYSLINLKRKLSVRLKGGVSYFI